MPKIYNSETGKKELHPDVIRLFDAIENGVPYKLEILDNTQLLSLADWDKHPEKDTLLPHDEVSDPKVYYSHVPHGIRVRNISEKKELDRAYLHAKDSGDPNKVAMVSLENL